MESLGFTYGVVYSSIWLSQKFQHHEFAIKIEEKILTFDFRMSQIQLSMTIRYKNEV